MYIIPLLQKALVALTSIAQFAIIPFIFSYSSEERRGDLSIPQVKCDKPVKRTNRS